MINPEEVFRRQIEEEKASMLYVVLKEGNFETLHRYKHEEKNQVIDMLKDYRYLDTRICFKRTF